MRKELLSKFLEALVSTLPIFILVIITAFVFTDVGGAYIGLFSGGAVLLLVGMTFFNLGADTSMIPMGDSVGRFISRTKKNRLPAVLIVCFIIGVVITASEPDVHVLVTQLTNGNFAFYTLLLSIAAGAGLFVVFSVLKTFFNLKLRSLLLISYLAIFSLAIALQFVNPAFLASAFDSGGVTTGPMTTPFLVAMGIGVAAARGSKGSHDESFGLIALCSTGPIIAVMIMGLIGISPVAELPVVPEINGFKDIVLTLLQGIPQNMLNVVISLVPIAVVFFIFQFTVLKLKKQQIIRILVGLLYTFVGLSIFLTGVNIGFLPVGNQLGASLALGRFKPLLVPLFMLMGAVIVLAEPAVHILNKQIEEVTAGAISKKLMLVCLCSSVAVVSGLSMVRVVTGISIWWFIAPVYAVSLVLMFFVPQIFTGIAFDSGGVASGSMTAAFMLPFAVGACNAISGTEAVLTDAFGLVAMVAMAPLITIQFLGLLFKLKTAKKLRLEEKAASLEKAYPAAGPGPGTEIIDFDMHEIVDEVNLKSKPKHRRGTKKPPGNKDGRKRKDENKEENIK